MFKLKNKNWYVNIYMVIDLKNKKTKALGFIFILILFLLAGFLYIKIYKDSSSKNVEKISTVDNIKSYGYSLNSNASKYYEDLFKELKEILNKDSVNEQDYAKKISQLYVTDLFTLSNKITSSDVGGVQFVYKDFEEDFISIAQTSLYSNVKSNVYGDRKQQLPEVSEVVVLETAQKDFKYKDTIFENSYYINVEIKYKKDMGYPTKYQVVISKNDKNLEVVKSGELK